MGRTSKELKELKEREKAYPALDKDYYLIRVARGNIYPPGWVFATTHRSGMHPATVAAVLKQYRSGTRAKQASGTCTYVGQWFMFVGPKPDKKWGPVCP